MVKNKKILVLLTFGAFLILVVLGGIGAYVYTKKNRSEEKTSSNQEPTPTPQFITYTDPSGKFSMQYPNGWEQVKVNEQIITMFKSPKESDSDPYLENVNVGKQESSDPSYTVDNYLAYAKDNLTTELKDFKLEREEKIKIDGVDAALVTFTSTSEGKRARAHQRYVIKDGFVYVITYTGYEESYGKFEDKGIQTLDSFNFL